MPVVWAEAVDIPVNDTATAANAVVARAHPSLRTCTDELHSFQVSWLTCGRRDLRRAGRSVRRDPPHHGLCGPDDLDTYAARVRFSGVLAAADALQDFSSAYSDRTLAGIVRSTLRTFVTSSE